MNTYETTATVEAHGQIHVAGVPFEPGTEVHVTIQEKVTVDATRPPVNGEQTGSMKDLFARVRARNTEPIGRLRREELYDRKVLR